MLHIVVQMQRNIIGGELHTYGIICGIDENGLLRPEKITSEAKIAYFKTAEEASKVIRKTRQHVFENEDRIEIPMFAMFCV